MDGGDMAAAGVGGGDGGGRRVGRGGGGGRSADGVAGGSSAATGAGNCVGASGSVAMSRRMSAGAGPGVYADEKLSFSLERGREMIGQMALLTVALACLTSAERGIRCAARLVAPQRGRRGPAVLRARALLLADGSGIKCGCANYIPPRAVVNYNFK